MAQKQEKKSKNSFPDTVLLAQDAIEDKLGRDIKVYDVRGRSSITDFFMIASASSAPQLKAIAENVKVSLKEHDLPVQRKGGDPESGWVVLDYIDVVIHLFLQETRAYYAIEELWEEAGQ